MIFLYIILGILALLLILTLVAPKAYKVTRSMTVNKSTSEVYNYLKYIKNQDEWSPWKKRDPNMAQTFTGDDGALGFVSHWDSDHKQVGTGEQEIIKLEEGKRVETALRFLKPFKSESTGFFDISDSTSGGSEVTWGFYGNHKAPVNVMMMFMNMDKAVGKDFEEGLSELKRILESR